MNLEMKWALRELQHASSNLQTALAADTRWKSEERERLIYCKSQIDAIVTKRLEEN